MQYQTETGYGISNLFIHSVDAVLFGTGQGSGASPAVLVNVKHGAPQYG